MTEKKEVIWFPGFAVCLLLGTVSNKASGFVERKLDKRGILKMMSLKPGLFFSGWGWRSPCEVCVCLKNCLQLATTGCESSSFFPLRVCLNPPNLRFISEQKTNIKCFLLYLCCWVSAWPSLASVSSRPRYNYSCPRDDYMFTLEAGRLPVPGPWGAASQRGSS